MVSSHVTVVLVKFCSKEPWIHYNTPESNRLSFKWEADGDLHPERLKMQESAVRVMAAAFWEAH